eukprot:4513586-Pyramimonas_sp.AAC.1
MTLEDPASWMVRFENRSKHTLYAVSAAASTAALTCAPPSTTSVVKIVVWPVQVLRSVLDCSATGQHFAAPSWQCHLCGLFLGGSSGCPDRTGGEEGASEGDGSPPLLRCAPARVPAAPRCARPPSPLPPLPLAPPATPQRKFGQVKTPKGLSTNCRQRIKLYSA